MADEPIQIEKGKWVKKDANGEWVTTTAPVTMEAVRQPVKPELDFSTRIKRAVRDYETPASTVFPPLAVADAIKSLVTGKPDDTLLPGIPVGTGQLRNTLTGTMGAMAATGAGGTALPSVVGAVPAAIAGYAGGASVGSGIGQEFEKADPDLFQSGYFPERKDSQPRTVPSLGNAIQDAAISGVTDLATMGVMRGGRSLLTKKGREALVERMMTKKYDPKRKGAIEPPLTREEVDAINATPNVQTTTGQVLDENSPFKKMQDWLRGEETSTNIKQQERQLAGEIDKFQGKLSSNKTPTDIGKAGLTQAQQVEKAARAQEGQAYNDITKFAGKYTPAQAPGKKPNPYNLSVPRQAANPDIIGPVKLAQSNAKVAVEGKAMDQMISEISDPTLAAELKIIRNRMRVGEDKGLKSWEAVREMETQLGRLSSNPNLPASLKRQLNDIRGTLVMDIEHNLEGKVKETAGYWKKGAIDQYRKAKSLTVSRNDMFPDEIQKAMENAAGEVANRPGARGGVFETFFKDVTKSPQDAARLATVGGKDNARSAFVQKFLDKHMNAETKQLQGNAALADWETDNIKGIAAELLDKDQRQKLRYLMLRSKEMNPNISKLGQTAIEMSKGNMAMNVPGEIAASAMGNPAGLMKTAGKYVTLFVGGGKFVDNYLLNDQFARRVANAMGKPANRPGMGQEMKEIIKKIQGAKILVQAEGKSWLYDTDTKTMDEVPQ